MTAPGGLNNKGPIYLTGSSANQALLDVTAGSAGFGAAGTLSGYVRLVGDSAIVEFASGQITQPWPRVPIWVWNGTGRLHRGQRGAGVEQRSDGARFDRRRGDVHAP